MSRMSAFSSPFMLGFDELERMLDHATKSAGDGYPPYNIEKLDTKEGDALRITLAVAGFARADMAISLEENQLTIAGKQADDTDRQFLHRGIAARQFKRTFVLADGMEVKGANLENGLLSIDLVRPTIEKIVRTIDIKETPS